MSILEGGFLTKYLDCEYCATYSCIIHTNENGIVKSNMTYELVVQVYPRVKNKFQTNVQTIFMSR